MKKKVKQYTLDELGELIVPHRLTDKEAKEISAAIKEDKERNKLKKATPFKLKIPSVFSEGKKTKHIFSLDDLLEQIGPRPLTDEDSRAFSEAIKKHKQQKSKKRESKVKLLARSRKYAKSISENEIVAEPLTRYTKSK